MSDYPIEHCRSADCRARIIWASTGHRSMPVDAEPSPTGNVRLSRVQGVVTARVLTAHDLARLSDDSRAELHTAHFATCTRAAEWRKR